MKDQDVATITIGDDCTRMKEDFVLACFRGSLGLSRRSWSLVHPSRVSLPGLSLPRS